MSSVINETLLAIKAAFEAGVNIFNGGTAVNSSNPLPVAPMQQMMQLQIARQHLRY